MKKNNLNYYRVKKGLTQQDIADNVGMSRTHVQTIEHYKVSPNVHLALKIANYLKVDVCDLFFN